MLRTLALVGALASLPVDPAAPGRALDLALVPAARAQGPASRPAFDHAHSAWSAVLGRFVRPDGFDYAGLKRDRALLDAYLAQLERIGPADLAAWSADERFAFWVNVYNAYTVALIVDHYPVASIRDVRDLGDAVWKEPLVPLDGLRPDGQPGALSLNDVEHGILRERFQDARVHAAVNCASESCPPLRAEAFRADRLDEQLDEQVRRWLSDPARNRLRADARVLEVSKIFEWFAGDFEREAGSVPAWIARHVPDEQAAWIGASPAPEVRYLDYSWRLNDASER